MGIEKLKYQTPETQKDTVEDRKMSAYEILEQAQKKIQEGIKRERDRIVSEGESLAKTPEEQKICESAQEEVTRVVEQADKATGSGFKEWQDAQDQELQGSLKG